MALDNVMAGVDALVDNFFSFLDAPGEGNAVVHTQWLQDFALPDNEAKQRGTPPSQLLSGHGNGKSSMLSESDAGLRRPVGTSRGRPPMLATSVLTSSSELPPSTLLPAAARLRRSAAPI